MTENPQRCEHYPVCWFVHTHHRCINDNPDDIPCIFDTRKSIDFTERATPNTAASEKVLDGFLRWVKPECVKELVRTYKAELRQQEGK